VFTRLFKEYGLPQRIRSDNGVPFATTTLARLSTLSAWWVRLGILPDLIEPGKPQQNGRHERMHRTLKAETTRPPAANRRTQQRKFNRFQKEFNDEQPHEALDMATPASIYVPSRREMPDRLPPLEYPDRFEVRYVSYNGGIRWNKGWVNVSITCAGEYVGLEEIDDGVWNVYFGRSSSVAYWNGTCGSRTSMAASSDAGKAVNMSPTTITIPGEAGISDALTLSRSRCLAAKMCNPCPRTNGLPTFPTAQPSRLGAERQHRSFPCSVESCPDIQSNERRSPPPKAKHRACNAIGSANLRFL